MEKEIIKKVGNVIDACAWISALRYVLRENKDLEVLGKTTSLIYRLSYEIPQKIAWEKEIEEARRLILESMSAVKKIENDLRYELEDLLLILIVRLDELIGATQKRW